METMSGSALLTGLPATAISEANTSHTTRNGPTGAFPQRPFVHFPSRCTENTFPVKSKSHSGHEFIQKHEIVSTYKVVLDEIRGSWLGLTANSPSCGLIKMLYERKMAGRQPAFSSQEERARFAVLNVLLSSRGCFRRPTHLRCTRR